MKKSRFLALPLSVWMLFFVGVALLYVVILSFLTADQDGYGVKFVFTLHNYQKLFSGTYLAVLLRSLLLALNTTLICFVIGYPFGYCMARVKPKWRNILMMLVIVPFWTNALVRIYGWKILLMGNGPINDLILWLGIVEKPLKLLNTYGAVLLGMVYALIPFMIMPAYTAIEKMDWSLVAASRDLGSSPARAFLTITLPLTAPGIFAGVIMVFIPAVGLFFISDLLGGATYIYAGNLVRDQLLKARDWPFAAAISVVLLLMTFLMLWAYRRAGNTVGDIDVF
jgi:spermidine/putrescine transport system permease protein